MICSWCRTQAPESEGDRLNGAWYCRTCYDELRPTKEKLLHPRVVTPYYWSGVRYLTDEELVQLLQEETRDHFKKVVEKEIARREAGREGA